MSITLSGCLATAYFFGGETDFCFSTLAGYLGFGVSFSILAKSLDFSVSYSFSLTDSCFFGGASTFLISLTLACFLGGDTDFVSTLTGALSFTEACFFGGDESTLGISLTLACFLGGEILASFGASFFSAFSGVFLVIDACFLGYSTTAGFSYCGGRGLSTFLGVGLTIFYFQVIFLVCSLSISLSSSG